MQHSVQTENHVFKAVFHSIDCGIVVLQTVRTTGNTIEKFTYQEANDTALRALSAKREHIAGRSILNTPLTEQYFRTLAHVADTGEPASGVLPLPAPNGHLGIRASFRSIENGIVATLTGTELQRTDNSAHNNSPALTTMLDSLSLIADISPDMMYIFDITTQKASYFNKEFIKTLGYTAQEIEQMGSNIIQLLLHPDDIPRATHYLQHVRASDIDGPFEAEYRVRHASGEWRWLLCREAVFKRTSDGTAQLLLGIAQDCTERKRAEEEARVSRHFIERIADVTPGLITVFNSKTGEYVYVSRATESMLGYPREPFLEHGMQYYSRFIHPEDLPRVVEENRRAIEHANAFPTSYNDRTVLSFEYRIRHASGEWRWLQTCGTIFERAADGSVERIINVSIDITQRREAEEHLRRATEELQQLNNQLEETVQQRTHALSATEERFRILARATNDVVWDWNLIDSSLWWNDNFKTLFGYSDSDITPDIDSWTKRLHPDDYSRAAASLHAAIDSGNTQWLEEYRFLRADGTYAYILDRGYVLHDSQGIPVRMIGSMSDITARRVSEEKLLRSEANLREAQRISHIGSWELDTENNTLSWSEETFRIYELDPATNSPELAAMLSSCAQPEELAQHMEEARHSGTPYQLDTKLVTAKGDKYVQIIGRPQFDAAGRCTRIYGTILDITERKKTEEWLQQSQQQLQLVINALPALIAYLDNSHRYRFVNKAYRQWFNLADEHTLIGTQIEDFMGLAAWSHIKHYIKRALSGETVVYEQEIPFLTGTRCIRAQYTPDIADDGTVRGLVALVIDISEQVKAQEQLRIQARVLESMREGVSLADENGVILYTNPAEDAIFGYEPGELVGKHVSVQNAYPEHENQAIVQKVIEQLKERGYWSGEFQNIKKDGTPFVTHARITSLEMSDKTYWVCVQEDITEEKQARFALEYQHKINSTITTNATAALFMTDATGRCTFMNPAAETMTGYAFAELQGQLLHSVLHTHTADARQCALCTALPLAGELRAHEDIFTRKDGTLYSVVCSASPIVEHGIPLATVLEVRDTTEEKKVQDAVREKSERLHAALAASGTGTFRWNIATDQIGWDANLDKLFGLPGTARLQTLEHFIDIVHPDDRPAVQQGFIQSAQIGSDFDLEFRVVWPDGSVHWLYERGKVICDAEQRPSYMTGACVDITAHKTDQERLQKSAERFRFLADNIPQVVWQATADGSVEFFNQHWYNYTGLSPEDSTNWNWVSAIHPDDLADNLRSWRSAVDTGQAFFTEHRIRRSDGAYRWHIGRGEALRDEQGHIVLWIGTNADIDDQKRFAEELEQRVQERTDQLMRSNDQLNRSNAELERFAYVASHDLQEPLRKITTFGERLAVNYYDALSERGQWYLDSMRNSARRMQTLIDDLLTFSRTARSNEVFELTDVHGVVQGILADLDLAVEQRQASVEVQPLPVVLAVPGQMRQLFQNLISNALKFNDKPQPRIAITSGVVYGKDMHGIEGVEHEHFFDQFYRIAVKDNGIGFDEKYLSKIFVIFQRLHNRTQYEGTGIGLAICKKIVDYHRGFITAHSTPGEGAEFVIYLPVAHK